MCKFEFFVEITLSQVENKNKKKPHTQQNLQYISVDKHRVLESWRFPGTWLIDV